MSDSTEVNKGRNVESEDFIEGPWYEDLSRGLVINHPRGRTITEADCVWISLLAGDRNQIHINKLYSEKNYPLPPFKGQLVVNGLFVLMVVNSITSPETSVSGIFLGIDKVKMSSPVFPGDTLTAKSKVLDMRTSKKNPQLGIVKIDVEGYKNEDFQVLSYEKTFMVKRKNKI